MGEQYSIMPDVVLDLAAEGKLTRLDVLLYAFLAKHCDRDGECYPSQQRLSQLVRADERSIRRGVKNLCNCGVLTVTIGNGRGHSSEYLLPHQKNRAPEHASPPKKADTRTPVPPKKADTTPEKADISRTERRTSEHPQPTKEEPTSRTSKKKVDFPAELGSEEFRSAWMAWEGYRREKKKALTPSTRRRQLKMLARMGTDQAIRSIDQSITAGWVGLFEPKDNGKPTLDLDTTKMNLGD